MHTRPHARLWAQGPSRTDYEERVDLEKLRQARVLRVLEEMSSRGIDALLLFKNENVRYLTGLRAQLIAGKGSLLNGCILTVQGDLILLASGGEIDRVRASMPWVKEVYAIPIMEAAGLVRAAVRTTIAPALSRLGLRSGARIGVDQAPFCLHEALAQELAHLQISDGDAVLLSARLVKLPGELAVMQESSAIAEAVTQSAIDAVRPGVRELEVAAVAMETLFRLGGEEAHVTTPFVASGEHMAPPNRIASDKLIREGDLVFIDIGAQWSGYFSDMGRTIICGDPHPLQQRVYTAVYDALAAAVEAMRAGNTNRDVERAVHAAAAAHDLQEHFLSLFIGHGVGIGANEPPYIGERLPGDEEVVLETGMTFAIEPLIWVPGLPGGAGVRLEDTVVVTPQGGIPLTRSAFDPTLLLNDRPVRLRPSVTEPDMLPADAADGSVRGAPN